MKSLCFTCKKMDGEDPQGDDVCMSCSPRKLKCEGYVPDNTNYSKIIQSPEELAAAIAKFLCETIDNCAMEIGSRKSCSHSNYNHVYEKVLNWLNREYESEPSKYYKFGIQIANKAFEKVVKEVEQENQKKHKEWNESEAKSE